jgi:hypothetical protein
MTSKEQTTRYKNRILALEQKNADLTEENDTLKHQRDLYKADAEILYNFREIIKSGALLSLTFGATL